jgi:hypothetical protein
MPLKPKEPSNEAGKQARQQYLEHAQKITGDAGLDYNTLYQRFAQNDWAAIKLDDAIALAALKSGHSPKEVVGILHQSPYLQYQVHGNKVPLAPMSQYVRSTVMKAVQKTERSPSQQKAPEHSTQQKPGVELE